MGVQQELLPDAARPSGGMTIPDREMVTVRAPEAAADPAQAQMSFEAYGSGEAFMGTCPDCGSQLEYAEGCVKCHVCGFSECG
jgi:ribonucleoside-diphosphate reductase alpha chain